MDKFECSWKDQSQLERPIEVGNIHCFLLYFLFPTLFKLTNLKPCSPNTSESFQLFKQYFNYAFQLNFPTQFSNYLHRRLTMGKVFRNIVVFSVVLITNVKSESACLNPSTSKNAGLECSGAGDCHSTVRGPDWCECDLVNSEGYYQFYGGKRLFGNWCQCNLWNCLSDGDTADFIPVIYWIPVKLFVTDIKSLKRSSEACSGAGSCECDELDPDAVAKCVCNENYSGDVCQDFNEPEAAIGAIQPAYEESMIAELPDSDREETKYDQGKGC